MTRFEDGPAQGQHLMLHRTPMFLRVTEAAGKFDALDQPHDSPLPIETLYAYRTDGPTGHCHVNMGRKGGGFYPMCSYRLCVDQPSDEQMRNPKLWHNWCCTQAPDHPDAK